MKTRDFRAYQYEFEAQMDGEKMLYKMNKDKSVFLAHRVFSRDHGKLQYADLNSFANMR